MLGSDVTGGMPGPSSAGLEAADYLDLIHGHNSWNPVTGVQGCDPDRLLFELVEEASSRDELAAHNVGVAEALKTSGWTDDGEKLAQCGGWAVLRSWAVSGAIQCRAANFCSYRSCRCCARVRAARAAEVYSAKTLELVRQSEELLLPRMVTITQASTASFGEGLRGMVRILRALSQKRRDVRRGKSSSEWAAVKHFAWAIEAKKTESGKGWHVHAHGVALAANRLDLDRLHEEYQAISGASHRPDVRLLQSGRLLLRHGFSDRIAEVVRADCLEVFKYAMKFEGMEPASVAEFHIGSRGKRLRFAWDGFRGCKVPDVGGDVAELLGQWLEGRFVRKAGRCRLARLRSGVEEKAGPWVDVVGEGDAVQNV